MTITNPRDTLADQNNFNGYLMGVSGIAQTVRTLGSDDRSSTDACADDFVYALLGIVSLGARIERLATFSTESSSTPDDESARLRRWLR